MNQNVMDFMGAIFRFMPKRAFHAETGNGSKSMMLDS
jgi:hypothetical protein